ncbi:MAG: zinc-dependent metalloprotease [Saprospiraceae bacterium]|nr:zinc-dependent metalloprotease [Saprospiraceae bacterium]
MIKRILPFLSLVLLMAAFHSCAKKEVIENQGLDQSVLNRIQALGFSSEGAAVTEGGYLVEGDIVLTEQDLNNVFDIQSLIVGNAEQYRTTLLVTGLPRTITVFINAGSGGGKLPASYGTALDIAIARYNAEPLTLNFLRVFSSGAGDIDIVKGNGSYLASAGFPTSGGDPFNSIKVNSNAIGNGSSSAFYNYLGSILAHEMGHCIGMRHTDYMDRSYSCGGGTANEGASTVGAINIPGTPTTADANSWMLACIGNLVDRPFNNNDKTALAYLY